MSVIKSLIWVISREISDQSWDDDWIDDLWIFRERNKVCECLLKREKREQGCV